MVQAHPYHLVLPSPWPIFTSFSLLCLTLSGVLYMHNFINVYNVLILSFFSVCFCIGLWCRDIISEGTYLGNHTNKVQEGLKIGFLLFILTEALFFFAIFWAYFHSALSPTIEIGSRWPPLGIEFINPFELPLLNTVILLSSGVLVTYGHHALISLNRKSIYGFFFTIILAILFTYLQVKEYLGSSFTISDGVFGSCFYFSTGFHGLHVLIGTIFLIIALQRIITYQYTDSHHVGLESSILYWHFVDIVWLFLYVLIYYWGS